MATCIIGARSLALRQCGYVAKLIAALKTNSLLIAANSDTPAILTFAGYNLERRDFSYFRLHPDDIFR
jgi:hypothetical protein